MKISICIPLYNARKYLPEALDSVRTQTYHDWELIVVEDGSEISSQDIVDAFRLSVTQDVNYITHSLNRGLPAARDTAIAVAKGQYVALLDADDVWQNIHLEYLVECVKSNSCDIAFSGCELRSHDLSELISLRSANEDDLRKMSISIYNRKLTIQPSSVLIRRKLFELTGPWSEGSAGNHCEDLNYWFQAAKLGAKFCYSGADSCLYRKHDSALTAQTIQVAIENAKVYERHYDWNEIPRPTRAQFVLNANIIIARLLYRKKPIRAAYYGSRSVLFFLFVIVQLSKRNKLS
ncbi:MAG: glycosyltransferase family 2 protein [Puniceicoccaceae bacterium]